MKPIKILYFIISIIIILVAGWYFFPAEGVKAGNVNLRYPSYAESQKGEEKEVDVDAVLTRVSQSFEMTCSMSMYDSLSFFRDYLTQNPNRIYLPNNDYTYFDTLFELFEQAKSQGHTYRVMHYGDSQIEMDRISSVLRQKLQELFGGSGPNMIPAIQTVPTISVKQRSTDLQRYTLYGDSSTRRAKHNRYGVMSQFCQVAGEGTISFMQTSHSQAFDNAKEISTVSVLLGHNSKGFKATLNCDKMKLQPKVLAANNGVQLITWDLPHNVRQGTITFKGNAEIYAVLLDGEPGVAIDNVALRGCTGTIFSRIDEKVMRQSFELLDTRLIVLQFGGNRMPSITSPKSISTYLVALEKQIDYMKRVAPKATLLFIGPADMSKRYNGKLGTWKGLPELNDSLRSMALRNNVAYWDMFNVMGGEGSMVQWVKHNPALAGPDYIHFTFTGAQAIGSDLAKSFTTYYDFYKLRQHVPSQEVINFVNRGAEDDLKHTPYWMLMPSYQPYKEYWK
jgi:lysophospholipase L1-like esterase